MEQVQSEEDWGSSDRTLRILLLDNPEIDFSDGTTQSSEKGLESLEEQKVDWDTFKDNTEYDGESYTYANARLLEEFGDIYRIRIILPC